MTIRTDLNSPIARAQTAAAIEIRGPSKGRSARHVYLAEIVKGALEAKYGGNYKVTIGYKNGRIHCLITDNNGQQVDFAQPTLSDVILSVNERHFPAHNRTNQSGIDYNAACEDVDKIRQEILSEGKSQEERSPGGIIIARR